MKYTVLPRLGILLATIIWGTSFIILKDTLDVLPPMFLLTVRFVFAAILIGLVFFKRMLKIKKKDFLAGIPIGICFFGAYFFQTTGLMYTTPGKNAFLTAVYCVLVPFIAWAYTRLKPDGFNIAAAVLCIVGIFFVAVEGDFSVGTGDVLTLIGGVFYAVHIVLIAKFAKDRDPIIITVLQFAYAAVLCCAVSLCCERIPDLSSLTAGSYISVIYLIVCCSALAMVLQNVGQKYVEPSSASLILSLEAVFGVLFSVLAGAEDLTPRIVIGFILIFIAVIISETKLSFITKRLSRRS